MNNKQPFAPSELNALAHSLEVTRQAERRQENLFCVAMSTHGMGCFGLMAPCGNSPATLAAHHQSVKDQSGTTVWHAGTNR